LSICVSVTGNSSNPNASNRFERDRLQRPRILDDLRAEPAETENPFSFEKPRPLTKCGGVQN